MTHASKPVSEASSWLEVRSPAVRAELGAAGRAELAASQSWEAYGERVLDAIRDRLPSERSRTGADHDARRLPDALNVAAP